jgi:hypothetical protein
VSNRTPTREDPHAVSRIADHPANDSCARAGAQQTAARNASGPHAAPIMHSLENKSDRESE